MLKIKFHSARKIAARKLTRRVKRIRNYRIRLDRNEKYAALRWSTYIAVAVLLGNMLGAGLVISKDKKTALKAACAANLPMGELGFFPVKNATYEIAVLRTPDYWALYSAPLKAKDELNPQPVPHRPCCAKIYAKEGDLRRLKDETQRHSILKSRFLGEWLCLGLPRTWRQGPAQEP